MTVRGEQSWFLCPLTVSGKKICMIDATNVRILRNHGISSMTTDLILFQSMHDNFAVCSCEAALFSSDKLDISISVERIEFFVFHFWVFLRGEGEDMVGK